MDDLKIGKRSEGYKTECESKRYRGTQHNDTQHKDRYYGIHQVRNLD